MRLACWIWLKQLDIDVDAELFLNQGGVLNAQNLIVDGSINIDRATIQGNGTFVTSSLSSTFIGSTAGTTTIQGVDADNTLVWLNEGIVTWDDADIVLNDAKIHNNNQFYADFGGFTHTLSGTGEFFNDLGASFGMGSSSVLNLNVTFDNGGIIDLDSSSDQLILPGNLTINYGGLITGSGSLILNSGIGTLFVENGGGIAPGKNGRGTLNVSGNFQLDTGGSMIMDIESSILRDQIQVSGNANIIDGDLYLLWENNGFTNFTSGATFTIIECVDPCLTLGSLNVNDPIGVTGASVGASIGSGVELVDLTLPSVSASFDFWTGSAGNDLWSDSTNWNSGSVPTSATNVIIDGAGSNIIVDIDTLAQVNSLQSDAYLTITGANGLDVVDTAYIAMTYDTTYTGLEVNGANASLSGTGKLVTLAGSYNHFHQGSDVTIAGWHNSGLICLEDTPVMNLNGTVFDNHGAFRFMQTDSATVSLSGGGQFNNFGAVIANPNASNATISISSNSTTGEIIVEQGTLSIDQSLDFNGQIEINSGGTLAITGGDFVIDDPVVGIEGSGTLLVNSGTSLDFSFAPAVFESTVVLSLDDGTIDNIQNLASPDIFNITGGTINGVTLFSDSRQDQSVVSYTGVTPLIVNGFEWVVNGDFNWTGNSAVSDIQLDSSSLVINGNMFINNTDSGADISGLSSSFEIWNDGIVFVQGAVNTDIGVFPVINGGIVLVNAASSLSFSESPLQVRNGGFIAGIGTLVGDVDFYTGGIVAPGNLAGAPGAGIGQLTIDGDVNMYGGSVGLFEMDATNGVADSLNINGNLFVEGDLHTQWDNVTSLTPIIPGSPYVIISTSGTISGDFLNFTDAVGTTGALATPGASTYTYDPNSAALDNFWTGAVDLDWTEGGNWDSGTVPTAADTIVVEGNDIVIGTPVSVAAAQIDIEDFVVDASLTVSGDLVTGQAHDINFNGGSFEGSGTWTNFGYAFLDANSTTFGIGKTDNYGGIFWVPVSDGGVDLTFSNDVYNYGGLWFDTDANPSIFVDFLGVNGLTNTGNIVSRVPE